MWGGHSCPPPLILLLLLHSETSNQKQNQAQIRISCNTKRKSGGEKCPPQITFRK